MLFVCTKLFIVKKKAKQCPIRPTRDISMCAREFSRMYLLKMNYIWDRSQAVFCLTQVCLCIILKSSPFIHNGNSVRIRNVPKHKGDILAMLFSQMMYVQRIFFLVGDQDVLKHPGEVNFINKVNPKNCCRIFIPNDLKWEVTAQVFFCSTASFMTFFIILQFIAFIIES